MRVALSKFSEDNFEKVNYLDPKVQDLIREFLCRIAMEGVYIRIPDDGAYRTSEQQQQLYNKRKTWVLCPRSYHCHGCAVDVVALSRIGPIFYDAIWSGRKYKKIARIAMELGLEWGYQLWGMDEYHFHYSDNLEPERIGINGGLLNRPKFPVKKKPSVLMRAIRRMQDDKVIPQNTLII